MEVKCNKYQANFICLSNVCLVKEQLNLFKTCLIREGESALFFFWISYVASRVTRDTVHQLRSTDSNFVRVVLLYVCDDSHTFMLLGMLLGGINPSLKQPEEKEEGFLSFIFI